MEVVKMYWQTSYYVAATIAISFSFCIAWVVARRSLRNSQDNLKNCAKTLRDLDKAREFQDWMRDMWLKKFTLPAAEKVAYAFERGVATPKTQVIAYLNSLVPLLSGDPAKPTPEWSRAIKPFKVTSPYWCEITAQIGWGLLWIYIVIYRKDQRVLTQVVSYTL